MNLSPRTQYFTCFTVRNIMNPYSPYHSPSDSSRRGNVGKFNQTFNISLTEIQQAHITHKLNNLMALLTPPTLLCLARVVLLPVGIRILVLQDMEMIPPLMRGVVCSQVHLPTIFLQMFETKRF